MPAKSDIFYYIGCIMADTEVLNGRGNLLVISQKKVISLFLYHFAPIFCERGEITHIAPCIPPCVRINKLFILIYNFGKKKNQGCKNFARPRPRPRFIQQDQDQDQDWLLLSQQDQDQDQDWVNKTKTAMVLVLVLLCASLITSV